MYYDKKADTIAKKNYYGEIDLLIKSDNLFDDLHNLIKTHKVFNYKKTRGYLYTIIDLHPNNMLEGIYSKKQYTAQEMLKADEEILELARQQEMDIDEESLTYNCEHTVPQSWFGKKMPMKTDLHHLYTAEARCNSYRGNYSYGETSLMSYEKYHSQPCGGYALLEKKIFEPPFSSKGNAARATLYFLLRYPDITLRYSVKSLELLKNWNIKDLPDIYECHRNAEIFKVQGNRNPLIDYPELVDKIDFNSSLKIV